MGLLHILGLPDMPSGRAIDGARLNEWSTAFGVLFYPARKAAQFKPLLQQVGGLDPRSGEPGATLAIRTAAQEKSLTPILGFMENPGLVASFVATTTSRDAKQFALAARDTQIDIKALASQLRAARFQLRSANRAMIAASDAIKFAKTDDEMQQLRDDLEAIRSEQSLFDTIIGAGIETIAAVASGGTTLILAAAKPVWDVVTGAQDFLAEHAIQKRLGRLQAAARKAKQKATAEALTEATELFANIERLVSDMATFSAEVEAQYEGRVREAGRVWDEDIESLGGSAFRFAQLDKADALVRGTLQNARYLVTLSRNNKAAALQLRKLSADPVVERLLMDPSQNGLLDLNGPILDAMAGEADKQSADAKRVEEASLAALRKIAAVRNAAFGAMESTAARRPGRSR